jgi:hypothetical protein
MKIHLRKYICSFFLIVLVYSSAMACECEIHKHRIDFRRATAVFIGTVTSITEPAVPEDIEDMKPQFSRLIKLKVDKRYKGGSIENEAVWSYEIPYSCGGFTFEVGKQYLIYIYRAQKGSRYATTACTRSRPMESGGDLLNEELNDLNRWTFRTWAVIWPF